MSVNNPQPPVQTPPAVSPVTAEVKSDGNGKISVLVTIGTTTYRVDPMFNGKVFELSDAGLYDFAERIKAEAQTILSKSLPSPEVLAGKTFTKDVESADLKSRVQKIIKNQKAVEQRDAKFEKDVPHTAAVIAAKVGAGLGLIVAAPVLGIAKAGYALKTRVQKIQGRPVREQVKQMNVTEKNARFNVLKEKAEEITAGGDKFPKSAEINASKQELLKQKLASRLKRSLDRADTYDETHIEQIVSKIEAIPPKESHFLSEANLKKYLDTVSSGTDSDVMSSVSREDLKEIVQESKLIIQPEKSAQLTADKQLWERFIAISSEPITAANPAEEANLKVQQALRDVLNSPSYQALKEDPTNEWIRGIHDYVVASYNGVKAADVYSDFGDFLAAGVPGDLNNDATQNEALVNAAYSYAERENLTDHGLVGKLVYIATHWKQAMGALSSQGSIPAEVAKMLGGADYDPTMLGNVSSVQATTTVNIDGNDVHVVNIYGGNPTVGGKISPEMHALCQAMENNKTLLEENRDKDIPEMLLYKDLQDNVGEAERGFAMRQLAKIYPNVVTTAQIPKDSDFVQMKGDYKNVAWTGVKEFGDQFLALMETSDCYGENVQNKRGSKKDIGYYLPFGKEHWVGENGRLKGFIDKVTETIGEVTIPTGLSKAEREEYIKGIRYAYIEAVNILIDKEIETVAGKKVSPDAKMWTMNICKEGIDRGGVHNAILAYVRGNLTKPEMFGLLFFRAFNSRDRILIKGRFKVFSSFVKHVDPAKMKDSINDLFAGQNPRYELTTKSVTPPGPVDVPRSVDEPPHGGFALQFTPVGTPSAADYNNSFKTDDPDWDSKETSGLKGHSVTDLTGNVEAILQRDDSLKELENTLEGILTDVKNKVKEVAFTDENSSNDLQEDLRSYYNKLSDGVVKQFKLDIERRTNFQVTDRRVKDINPFPPLDLDPAVRLLMAKDRINEYVGENDEKWKNPLQALITQAPVNCTVGKFVAEFNVKGVERQWQENGQDVRLGLETVNGIPPTIQLNIERNKKGLVDSVEVVIDADYNIVKIDDKKNKTVVSPNGFNSRGSFTLRLNDDGEPVIEDFQSTYELNLDEELRSPDDFLKEANSGENKNLLEAFFGQPSSGQSVAATSSPQPSSSSSGKGIETGPLAKPARRFFKRPATPTPNIAQAASSENTGALYWNNHEVIVDRQNEKVSIKSFNGEFVTVEGKIYDEDPAINKKKLHLTLEEVSNENSFTLLCHKVYIRLHSFEELVSEVNEKDKLFLEGIFKNSEKLLVNGEYEGYRVEIVKEREDSSDSFTGKVLFFKGDVYCGKVDDVKVRNTNKFNTISKRVNIGSAENPYFIRKKVLDRFVKQDKL